MAGKRKNRQQSQRTRNIVLTPQLDHFVQSKINSGRYQSASEVVREGLRIMEHHEQHRQRMLMDVGELIRSGYEQIQRGQTLDADEVFAGIKSMSRAARKAAARRAS